jgi:hypothetical protein
MKANPKISKLFFPLVGLGALIWFLVRVIPKPSRAAYPCQRAAFPIASGFVLYLLGLMTSAFALKKVKKHWKGDRYWVAAAFSVIAAVGLLVTFQGDAPYAYGSYQSVLEGPNQPMGVGKGIFPGRVVWVRDSSAVNQQYTNQSSTYWWQDANANQTLVNGMVSKALTTLTGKASDSEAWDAIFRYYNQTHGRGDVGYTAGEKIVMKINLNNGTSGSSYTRTNNRPLDTSPQIVYAVLDQLVHNAGVAQADIGFGDPGRNVDNIFWDKFHQTFPDVKYWGNGNGRTPIVQSSTPVFMNSDGTMQNYLPTCYLEATYMINIPILKQHHRAGISLTSKNHFGTFVPFLGNAFPLHYSTPCTEGDGNVNNGSYGEYRIFVDFIGHKDLGGKTILYLIDGLWSSTNWGDPPWKWRMAPFNNSYPASIFASQDPVAIESVGFDFLYNEFYPGNPSGNAFPHYSGVDDYLHQAADSLNWPEGMKYDPEGDGTYLPRSMGVHEHWNNASDMKYSRDLGAETGIQLVRQELVTSVGERASRDPLTDFRLEANYPNPFNPSTTLRYHLPAAADVELSIFNVQGMRVQTLVRAYQTEGNYEVQWDGRVNGVTAASGVYFAKLYAEGKQGTHAQARTMLLLK